jgi:glycosyltransferase involved in cell wall biosynthesis
MAIQASIDAGVPINVIGDGNLAESLMVQYGKSDSVKFLGYLNNPWACISPESIVVVPSEYEGDGIVVLEAIQNGNPILLRDIADLRRFNLNDENYFKNQNQLTVKLKEYRENPSLFTIPNSEQDRILANRDIRAIEKQWSVLIDELFEGER